MSGQVFTPVMRRMTDSIEKRNTVELDRGSYTPDEADLKWAL